MFFSYTQAETEYLKSRDKKLAAIIDRVGFIERKTEKDVFSELVLSVLGQQISNKAFETVKRRFTDAIGVINAENILHMGIDGIRGCGVSGRKAENICAIAESVLSGGFDPSELVSLSDDEVIKRLTAFRGVGTWTAEMILIFCLERKNILSFGDFGIRRGIELLYGEADLTKKKMKEYLTLYSPYATVASFYLWKVGNGEIIPTEE